MVRDWASRESFPRTLYSTERYSADGIDETRYPDASDMHRRQPPMQIDEALRQYCGISARRVFVAVILDDGNPMIFSGPRLSEDISRQFFDKEAYRRVMSRLDAAPNSTADEGFGLNSSNGFYRPPDFPRNRMTDRRRLSSLDDWDASALRQGRKRARNRHLTNDDDDVPVTVSTTRRGIKINDSADLEGFYEQRFKNCQQTACKLIAKAWVKAVEPKKQSTHPYTGSDARAPDWWPKPWGETKEEKVRHKEPDHLYKRERVALLKHILKMIVEPNKTQHPDIQKLNLNIRKLEEITTEALSAFFADKENPANAKKRPYLNEIFKVAKQEERFKNGEIDGTTEVYVMADDKLPETYPSENDDGSLIKEEDEQDASPTKSATTHGLIHTPTTDHSPATTMNGAPFMGDLPVRGNSYPASVMHDLAPEQHGFVEGSGLPVNGQTPVHGTGGNLGMDMGVPHSHDSSRRPSLFSAPTDYSSQNGTALYTQPWQPGSTAPNTSTMYAFNQPPTNSTPSYVNSGVAMNQNQPYLGSSFDGLSRNGYDPNQSNMFRTGNVSQPQVHPTQGYSYLPHDPRGLSGVKVDPSNRSLMH